MGIISLVLTALALSMDAMAVSISSGMAAQDAKKRMYVKMAFFFGFFQFAMPVIGYYLGVSVSQYITAVDHWIAFGLLAFIGIRMIAEACKKDDGIKPKADPFANKTLLIMAVATSIDALAVGVSFAMTETRIWVAAPMIGVITFLCSLFGAFIGKKLGELFKKGAEIAGGIVLVGIGLKILIEHLIG